MRRDDAKAAGNAAYIVWLEDRLAFSRYLVCALLSVLIVVFAAFGSVLAEQEDEPVKTAVYAPATPAPTPAAKPAPAAKPGGNPLLKYLPKEQEKTVYVSRNGIIHTDPHCSGMTYYTEMTLSDALKYGYSHCSKCGYD